MEKLVEPTHILKQKKAIRLHWHLVGYFSIEKEFVTVGIFQYVSPNHIYQ